MRRKVVFREIKKKIFHPFSIWLQWPALGQAKTRNQKLHPGLPCGTGAQTLELSVTAFPGSYQEAGLEVECPEQRQAPYELLAPLVAHSGFYVLYHNTNLRYRFLLEVTGSG